MLPKKGLCLQKSLSPALKTVIVIATVFVFLSVVVAFFYTFFNKCDRMKFTYSKKGRGSAVPAEPKEDAPEVDLSDDANL